MIRDSGPARQFGPRVMSVERVVVPEAIREPSTQQPTTPSPVIAPQDPKPRALPAETEAESNDRIADAELRPSAMVPLPEKIESSPVADMIQFEPQKAPTNEPRVIASPLAPTAALRTAPAPELPRLAETAAVPPGPAERPISPPKLVETVRTENSSVLTEKLLGHRDLRPPGRSNLPVAPRVEFFAEERIVEILQRPLSVRGEGTSRTPEPLHPSLSMNAASETDAIRTVPMREPQMPVVSSGTEAVHISLKAIRETALRREPTARISGLTQMQFSGTTPQRQRQEPESTIQIKRIDIQVVNEEKHKTTRSPGTVPTAGESIGQRFDRQYMREVI